MSRWIGIAVLATALLGSVSAGLPWSGWRSTISAAGSSPGTAILPDDDDEKSNPQLHDEMEKLRSALRKLRRALRADDQGAAALQSVTDAQLSVHKTKAMTPIKISEMKPEAAKKAQVEYRLQMIEVARLLLDCEAKLVAGDLAGARKVHERIKPMERSGHEKFRD